MDRTFPDERNRDFDVLLNLERRKYELEKMYGPNCPECLNLNDDIKRIKLRMPKR